MKVVVSSAGRFWSFHLAEQLEKRSALKFLFTNDFKRKSDKIPKNKIKGLLRLKFFRLLEIASFFVPMPWIGSCGFADYKRRLHDKYVAEQLKRFDDVDIFVGWLGSCLQSLEQAKKKHIITIVESGSTHPAVRAKILKEEYMLTLKKTLRNNNSHDKKAIKELELSDYVAIPSKFVKKSFISQGFPESKLIVVPYGVKLEQFKQVKKKDSVFRVIWCGTICIRKGIHYLIRAFHELNLLNSELILIGSVDREMLPFLKKYKTPKIVVLGPKPQNQLYKFYSQGSVFVHPSVEEGLSMVQLEAMACGLPLICTTNTGGEDVIREGKEGFIVPIRDVDVLKDKIKYLYHNPNICSKLGKNAKERVKRFTWNGYGKKIIDKYQNILMIKKDSK